MIKLCCVTGKRAHPDTPIINCHQSGEMILEEAKDISPDNVVRLLVATYRCSNIVEDVYRINAVIDSAKEFKDALFVLNRDNVEAILTTDRRFRSYVMEFDMFLDYWETAIAHYRKTDGTTDYALIQNYKHLFRELTHAAYDNNVEYQLLDMIRNQTAHVQSPVYRVHVGCNGNEAFSSRDILLKKCRNGDNKKKFLRKQEEDIALSPIVDVTENCLKNIHVGLIDYQINESLIGELGIIKNFIEYIISNNHLYEPWIIMDDEKIPPWFMQINDMKAYMFLLDRLKNRGK